MSKKILTYISIFVIISLTSLSILASPNSNADSTLPEVDRGTVKFNHYSNTDIGIKFDAVPGANQYNIQIRKTKFAASTHTFLIDSTLTSKTVSFVIEASTLTDSSTHEVLIEPGEHFFLKIFAKYNIEPKKQSPNTYVAVERRFETSETPTSSINIASYNLLFYPYYDAKGRKGLSRLKLEGDLVKTNSIDILGTQENWVTHSNVAVSRSMAKYSGLKWSYKNTYITRYWKQVSKTTYLKSKKKGPNYYLAKYRKYKKKKYYLKVEKTNWTPCTNSLNQIYYKSSKFSLVKCGSKKLDSAGGGDAHTRYMAYTLLERKSDSKRFYVFSAHLTNIPESSTNRRINEANKVRDYIISVAKSTPYILTGDFNSSYYSANESAASVINTKDNQDIALTYTKGTNLQYRSYGAFSAHTPLDASYIDHILISKDFQPNTYKVHHQAIKSQPSDHSMISGLVWF